jgi:DNA-binding response OmpR family regulator
LDYNLSITGYIPFIFAEPLYEVISAAFGIDALAKLDGNPNGYDVIIVDQKMPHLSGVELVQGIRERGITGKILVLSAHLSPQVREAYHQMGVLMVMDKPFNVAELRVAVDQLAA